MFKFTVLILSTILLTSCATKVHGLQKSPSFNYTNVVSGSLVIGGVAHTNSKWNNKKQISVANQFKTEIIEERRDIRVDNAGYFIKRVGLGLYRETMREIAEQGVLSDNTLTILSQTIADRRYVVFARIENDQTTNGRDEKELEDSEGKKTGERKLTTYTNRSMDINFIVYDLMSKQQSWNGIIKKQLRNDLEYTIKKDTNLKVVIDLFTGKASQSMDKKYPYPKVPSDTYVLAKAFQGFAENLPEKD